jgi:ribosome-binding factor A
VARPPSDGVRPLRVGEELRHILAALFARGELRDPVLDGLILSVTEVRMTPDLRLATVYVRALAHPDPDAVVKALAREAKPIRAEIARRARLRVVPELRFRTDESFDAAGEVDALLRRPDVARDLARD